jgi:DNA polymerase-3 subunit delta
LILKPSALGDHLAGPLAPIYLVSGAEPLLVQEACDAILAAATTQGYLERSVLFVESGFKWHDLTQNAASMSLFAKRRVLDVRVPANKLDREASEMLRSYLRSPMDDTVILLRTERLEVRKRNSAWFKALAEAGVIVLVWPIGVAELPRWVQGRLLEASLKFDDQALTYFCQRVEGNLLAAVQEIEKLALADLPEPISVATLAAALEDASHYDTFELLDAVYAADSQRVSRMVRGLREEGVSVFAILGALAAQLRNMLPGGRTAPQRRRLVEGFIRRLGSPEAIDRVLAQCAIVDQQGKGQLLGDVWVSLENLLLRLAGVRLPSLEKQLMYLVRH